MVSIKLKKIGNKKYMYAEYSFRLPDKTIKKLSKLIEKKEDANKREIKDYFTKKEIESYCSFAVKKYKADAVLTAEKMCTLEAIRVEYKHLLNRLTEQQMKDVLDRFTINFTYESNALEGNSLTLRDVTMILAEKIVPKGKDLREIYETKNTREANELLFNNKIKITIKDIIKSHSILIRETGISEGFKRLPNFLLMRDVKTTAPEKVQSEMESLVAWYNGNKSRIHPIKLAAEFHAQFEKIHPFEDGNGRAGRLLINAIFIENGYPPLIIRKTMRQAYFAALEAYDNDSKPKLERFIVEKLEKTFENFFKIYVKYV